MTDYPAVKKVVSSSFIGHMLNTIVTTVATLTVAMTTLQGDIEKQSTDRLNIVFNRVSELENQVADLQDQVITINAENTALKAENTNLIVRIGILQSRLELGPESGAEYVFDLIESLDVPAWCKRWVGEPPHFEMAYVNGWYEFRYKVSREKYIGSTDFEIHPVQIAKAFNENDLKVYKEKGWADFSETIRNGDGELQERRFWKFYHKISDGPELICGWEIPTTPVAEHSHAFIIDYNTRNSLSLID